MRFLFVFAFVAEAISAVIYTDWNRPIKEGLRAYKFHMKNMLLIDVTIRAEPVMGKSARQSKIVSDANAVGTTHTHKHDKHIPTKAAKKLKTSESHKHAPIDFWLANIKFASRSKPELRQTLEYKYSHRIQKWRWRISVVYTQISIHSPC